MNIINYSSLIRNHIYGQYKFISRYLKKTGKLNVVRPEYVYLIYSITLDSVEEDVDRRILITNKSVTSENLESAKTLSVLSRIQMYTDYYRFLKFHDVIYNTDLTDDLYDLNTYEDIRIMFDDDTAFKEMVESTLGFIESSEYDKVLLTKCLSDKDREHLLKMNPFFSYELLKYDVEVNLNFLNEQLKKWQHIFPNNKDKSYSETTLFLMDLYKINKDVSKKVIKDMMDYIGTPFLNDYCPNEENNIIIDDYVVDDIILNQIIKNYDEEKSVTLKYTKGDENADK